MYRVIDGRTQYPSDPATAFIRFNRKNIAVIGDSIVRNIHKVVGMNEVGSIL